MLTRPVPGPASVLGPGPLTPAFIHSRHPPPPKGSKNVNIGRCGRHHLQTFSVITFLLRRQRKPRRTAGGRLRSGLTLRAFCSLLSDRSSCVFAGRGKRKRAGAMLVLEFKGAELDAALNTDERTMDASRRNSSATAK